MVKFPNQMKNIQIFDLWTWDKVATSLYTFIYKILLCNNFPLTNLDCDWNIHNFSMHCGQNLTEIIFKIVKRFLKGNIVIYRSERYLSYQKDHSTLSFYPLIQLTSDPQKSKAHLRVSEAVLYTLAGYLDWVSMNLIFTNNSVLLQMLCLLLGNSSLQLLAAECLLTIVGRKVNYNQEVFLFVFSGVVLYLH